MNLSPGLIALYWAAASFATAVAFSATARAVKRAAHHAGARYYCGTCQR